MSIKIDYISIVFDSAMAEEVIKKVLGLPIDIFLKGILKLKSNKYIDVDLKMDEVDLTQAESRSTYVEIKQYVLDKTGFDYI